MKSTPRAQQLLVIELSELNSAAMDERHRDRSQGEGGTLSISIATDRPPSSTSMIDTTNEGVAHGKVGGDGRAGREVSAGSYGEGPKQA